MTFRQGPVRGGQPLAEPVKSRYAILGFDEQHPPVPPPARPSQGLPVLRARPHGDAPKDPATVGQRNRVRGQSLHGCAGRPQHNRTERRLCSVQRQGGAGSTRQTERLLLLLQQRASSITHPVQAVLSGGVSPDVVEAWFLCPDENQRGGIRQAPVSVECIEPGEPVRALASSWAASSLEPARTLAPWRSRIRPGRWVIEAHGQRQTGPQPRATSTMMSTASLMSPKDAAKASGPRR